MLHKASSEVELLRTCLKGDTAAFEAIVKKYQSLVCSITFSATTNLDKSEELAQEAFIRAWTNLTQLKDLTKFQAWLCSIVRNIVRNYMRDKKRDVVGKAASIDKMADISSESFEPVEATINKEQQVVIRQALEQIPEAYREPLVLFYREQKSLKQVAKLLELSEDAAKTRVSRGRKLLREQVAAMVESTISRTGPGKAFTTAVVASIAGMAIKGTGVSIAAGIAATGTKTIVKTVIKGTAVKTITAVAAVAIGVGAVVTYRHIVKPKRGPDSFIPANTLQEQERSDEAEDVTAMEQAGEAKTFSVEKQQQEAANGNKAAPVAVEEQAGENVIDDSNIGINKTGVSGFVIDKQTSRPIKSAEIFYSLYGERHSVVTDVNGHFEFLDMQPSERQYINVIAKNFTTRRMVLKIVKNEVYQDFRIELTRGAKVAGIVTDENGKPIIGAKVRTFDFTNYPVITAEDGEFEIDGLDPAFGQYSMQVTHPNYPDVQVSFPSPAAGQTALRDVILKPGVTVHGRITDLRGNPVADVDVGTTTSRAMWNSIKAKTDEDGIYKLENVPMGELVLWAISNKHAPYVEQFFLDRSETRKLIDIQLDDPRPLCGKIVDSQGFPVPDVTVRMWEYKGVDGFVAQKDYVTCDSGGRFMIPNAPSMGKVTISVYGEGISNLDTELEMGQKEFVITVHRERKLYGKVVDDKTDAPIKRFNVKLRSSKTGSNPGWGYPVSWSDVGHYFDSELGFFETDNLQVGAEYSLTVYAVGFDPLTIDPIVVQPVSQDSSRTEFRLKTPNTITGRIVDSNDAPIAGARIRFLTDDNKFYHYDDTDTTFSNSKGEFNLAGIGTAESCIYITAKNFGPYLGSSLTLHRDSDGSIKIVLAPGANVFGTVFGLDGRGVSNAKVSAHVDSWRLFEMLSSPYPNLINTITDADGYYELLDLPDGPISVRVSSSPNPGSKRINLKPDQTVELNFGDEVGFKLTGVVRMGQELLGNANITVILPDRSTKDGHTDSNGQFKIKGVPKGTYEVAISYYDASSEDYFSERRQLVVDGDIELDFDLGAGTVSGKIPEQFVGMENLNIIARRWAPKTAGDHLGLSSDWEPTRSSRDIIDPEGYFTCSNLRAGRYYLLLYAKQGIMGISDVFELGESENLEDIAFNIGNGRIHISVIDLETGDSIPNAAFAVKNDLDTVFFSEKLAPDKQRRTMSTDEEGKAEYVDLPEGKYTVVVQTPGYLTAQSDWVSVNNDEVTSANVYLERSAVVRFELSAQVRRRITAETAYIRVSITDLDTGQGVPKPTSMYSYYREYDEHTLYLVRKDEPERINPAIDLPQGLYRIEYRLYQDKQGYMNTTRPPLVEGEVSVELLKGKTTTIIVVED